MCLVFFFSSRRRHTRFDCDWSSDVCSSDLFAPVRGLGLICVDEEHDPSYKQESDPRYDARTVAAKRAALEGAVAVYGSATPRPESWAALERLELGGRLTGRLPTVRVVDLRREAGLPPPG